MNKVKIGVIGLGTMGMEHVGTLNTINDCVVSAVCDSSPERINQAKEKKLIDENVLVFDNCRDLIDSDACDTVAIVTPHPFHNEIAQYAFAKNLHVMCDKPITVSVSEADKMIASWKQSTGKFSSMFTMRTYPINLKIKELIDNGTIGKIRRVEMTCTEWLRTQVYYDEQKWRGTWKGEGGGLLVNQAPHNLDLMYWFFGEIESVISKANTRFHKMETEDEVYAWITTKSKIPINFYATTGEYPGKDHLEIVGDLGTLIKNGNTLTFKKLNEPLGKTIRESKKPMAKPGYETICIETKQMKGSHKEVFKSFIDCIIKDKNNSEMISPGDEGIHSIELANGMLLASFEKGEIKFPVNRKRYTKLLDDLKSGTVTL